jgi:hypothetical protein
LFALTENNSKRSEKNRKHNALKKEKKKKKKARAAVEGAVVEEEAQNRGEAVAPELVPSFVQGERPVAGDNNDNQALPGGGSYEAESGDEEVELCRCIHCLELEDSLKSEH